MKHACMWLAVVCLAVGCGKNNSGNPDAHPPGDGGVTFDAAPDAPVVPTGVTHMVLTTASGHLTGGGFEMDVVIGKDSP